MRVITNLAVSENTAISCLSRMVACSRISLGLENQAGVSLS